MAYLLGCENVQLEYPTARLFDSLTLGVNSGDRIGIVGRNGDGKSTLLKLLAGEASPDDGRVVRTGNVTVGMLAQKDALDDDDTVGHAIVGDRPEYEWAGDARVRAILEHLVSDLDWNAKIGTLSGGQRRRVDLARVLIGDYDVLMMDEPTNHLDIEGIHWLAEHLKTRWRDNEGALLLVTHDRWFLDEVCLNMWEVHDRVVTPFEGGYSAYIMQRVERQRQARVAEAKRKNILRRELAWLARGAPARSTKPRFRVEAAEALIADEPPLRKKVELRRTAMSRLGKKVIHVRDASVELGGKEIIKPLEWNIGAGERIANLGANGAGKTTLLKLIEGKIHPNRGRVEIGKTVKFAVLTQQRSELDELGDDRVREVGNRHKIYVEMADGKTMSPMQLLEELGFEADQLSCPVRDLSGGQKRRLQLMLILLDRPNVLILDEPGNDLDTDMLAQLETLLDSWPGTLLIVSHDRYLSSASPMTSTPSSTASSSTCPAALMAIWRNLSAGSRRARHLHRLLLPETAKRCPCNASCASCARSAPRPSARWVACAASSSVPARSCSRWTGRITSPSASSRPRFRSLNPSSQRLRTHGSTTPSSWVNSPSISRFCGHFATLIGSVWDKC